jgi:serine/threonine protein kinase
MNAAAPLSGRYKFVKPLGQGGFGCTYLVKYLGLPSQPLRVVKQFQPKFSDPTALTTAKYLFDQEAKVLEQLGRTHDQIPELFEHLEDEQEFYLIQEYVAGESLEQILAQKTSLSEPEVTAWLADILQVLAFVHEHKVIHRDVTPSNLIQRQSDRKIVLIDFGAVKEVIQTGVAKLTIPIGKPGYIPTEQSAGTPRFCSDIYAVGMIGIQALTGQHPLQLPQDPDTGVVRWQSKTQISPGLTEILTKMVQPDCAQRYQTATAALQALQQLAGTMPRPDQGNSSPAAANPTMPQTLPPVAVRSPRLGQGHKFALGALGLILGGLAIYGLWPRAMTVTQSPPAGCPLPDVPKGEFRYSGSTTWAPLREIDAKIAALCPHFQVQYIQPDYRKPGSGTGIQMLLNGQIDFAQSSRQPDDNEYAIARNRGSQLQEIPIAIDGIAIAVNPKLEIRGLTISQIQAIYTGRVTNWQQVGGPDLEIVPYSRRREDSGTVDHFMAMVMEKQALGANVRFVDTTTQAVQKIAADPGGIYYGSAPEVVSQCKIKPLPVGRQAKQWVAPYQGELLPPEKCSAQNRNRPDVDAFRKDMYPLSRRLFIIIKKNGQIAEQAGSAYANLLLTPLAQDLIEQEGFVRIH